MCCSVNNNLMKTLIVVPSFEILGGVANHYYGLFSHWTHPVKHIFYGRRKKIPAILTFIPDLLNFIATLLLGHYDVVIVNPSLRRYQLFRDGIYLRFARLLGKKVVTFIHGWDNKVAAEICKAPKNFKDVYGKSEFIYVLYSDFKKQLESFNLQCPVLLTTTKVKDSLLEQFQISERNGKIERLLFLARADKLKGLDITIKTFEILKRKNPLLKLCVCGTGNALQESIDYVKGKGIPDIEFRGHVQGSEVTEVFRITDLYILPTHGEGMATSVLEAMAFGLPVVTRPVGGVNDFFEEGKMGYLVESFEPEVYAEKIQYLIDHPEVTQCMSSLNYHYANEHFLASKVVEKFEADLKKYC